MCIGDNCLTIFDCCGHLALNHNSLRHIALSFGVSRKSSSAHPTAADDPLLLYWVLHHNFQVFQLPLLLKVFHGHFTELALDKMVLVQITADKDKTFIDVVQLYVFVILFVLFDPYECHMDLCNEFALR